LLEQVKTDIEPVDTLFVCTDDIGNQW